MNRPLTCTLLASCCMFFGSGSGWSQTAAPPSPPAVPPQQLVGATHYDGWYTFNGNLENQKYSQADQITPQNVGKLQKAWEVHTGDVSDGSGKIPLIGLVRDAAFRQRHRLCLDAVLPHFRDRARYRQGQVDL